MGRLLRTAKHAAVASTVHSRVQRRQQGRFAAPPPVAPAAPPVAQPPVAPTAPQPATGTDMQMKIDQLTQLGQLRDAGVLTEVEFEVKKAEILR